MDSAHGQPALWRARAPSIANGLEEIRWIDALGGKSLPAASYGILPNLKKSLLFAIRDGSSFLNPSPRIITSISSTISFKSALVLHYYN